MVGAPLLASANGTARQAAASAIDHVTLGVRDFAATRRFYAEALEPLGLAVSLDWADGRRLHLGLPGEPSVLWVVGAADEHVSTARLAFAAPQPAAVRAFHAAAIAAGGEPLDPPRVRDEHTARTYAAAVADADGNVLEAFCWA